jgi:hypothetical protein
MDTSSKQIPISTLKLKSTKINPNPSYQRGAVWTTEKKQLLIDSILRGYDIPKIYLRMLPLGSPFDSEIVDGQQRLRAIWDFVDNKYPLGNESVDFNDMNNLDGKYYSDLSAEQMDKITAFSLTVAEIRDADDTEVRELFLRLQEGTSLNPPEKRNAMIGNMRDFVHEISKYPIFAKTTVSNTRFEHADYAAHIVALEIANGPCNVKADDLKRMYKNYENFDSNSTVAKKIKKVLKYMDDVFPDSCPELRIKWGFVDLYWLISRCIEQYDISSRHQSFAQFYIAFESERSNVADSSDLLKPGCTEQQKDLYNYIAVFQREGANRTSIEKRAEVYFNRLLESYQDLVPKDARRQFTDYERVIIWRNAFMKCQKCHINLPNLTDMHADHIMPHSKGGFTTISNAQCLCSTCNQSKSNTV